MKKNTLILFLLFSISCAKEFKNDNNEKEMPSSWGKEIHISSYTDPAVEKKIDWWKNFNDEELNKLIEQAFEYNSDIKTAIINIEQAKAGLLLSKSNIFPSLNSSVSAERFSNSKKLKLSNNSNKPTNNLSIDLDMNYQIDIWSKLSNASKSSEALLFAANSTKDNTKLTVASSIAKIYFNILSLNAQKSILKELTNINNEIYELKKLQYKVGTINQEDLFPFNTYLSNTEIDYLETDQNIIKQINALKIFIGLKPNELIEDLDLKSNIENINIAHVKTQVLPSMIITQRPDIKYAEEILSSANIEVNIARSYYLPDISITGLIGVASSKIDDLFKSSGTWSIGSNLASPLFNYNKNIANVKIKEAIARKALIEYQTIIKVAITEVIESMSAQDNYFNIYQKTKNNEDIQNKIDQITRLKYSVGYSSYLDVLLNRKILLENRLFTLIAKQNQIIGMIDIYKSLGGSW